MRLQRLLPPVTLLACVALGWQIGGADRFGRGSLEAAEADRLRAHFAQVEQELLARDVSALSPKQQSARAEQIRRLRVYAEAGEFPRNDFHPGARVPYFRDARGNLCAMAFLIAASGRGDIVDHIARTRNYAYMPDLADEPGLAGWLEDNGLTVAEAARIQPSYDGEFGGHTPPSNAYLLATGVTTGLSGISVALNARSPRNLPRGPAQGVFGLGVGTVAMAMGIAKIGAQGGSNQLFGGWNFAVGATAAFLGARALSKRNDAVTRAPSRLSLVPTALAADRPAIGFQGSFRF